VGPMLTEPVLTRALNGLPLSVYKDD